MHKLELKQIVYKSTFKAIAEKKDGTKNCN